MQEEEYPIAWKSIEAGRVDYLNATAAGKTEFPGFIGFKTPSMPMASQPADKEAEKQVNLVGGIAGQTDHLIAFALKEDEKGNEIEHELGVLNLVSYAKIRNKVVLVPVNGASVPANVKQEINAVFAQSVAEWDVVIDAGYTVHLSVLEKLDAGESGMLASFPKNMRDFIQTFKKERDEDKNAYYLFIIPGKQSTRAGFMPFKRQFGFIYPANTNNTARTIAHELAHGAFRLRHTFSPEAFIAGQGKTNNLMDYPAGPELRKFQWDNVHEPESMNGWFEDDAEVAMDGLLAGVSWEPYDCSGCTFLSPAGSPFYLSEKIVSLAVLKKAEAGITSSAFLKEAIYGYKLESGATYFANIPNGQFTGYFQSTPQGGENPEIFPTTIASFGAGMELNLWSYNNENFTQFIVNDISSFNAPTDWANYSATGPVVNSVCFSCLNSEFKQDDPKTLEELATLTAEIREKQYALDIARFRKKIEELEQSGEYFFATGNSLSDSDEAIINDKLKSYQLINQKYNKSSNRRIFMIFDEITYALPGGTYNDFAKDVLEGLNLQGEITLIVVPYFKEEVAGHSGSRLTSKTALYPFGGAAGYGVGNVEMNFNDLKSYFLDIYRNINKPMEIHSYLVNLKGEMQYYLASYSSVKGYDHVEGLNIYTDKEIDVAIKHLKWQNQSQTYKNNSSPHEKLQQLNVATRYFDLIYYDRVDSDYEPLDYGQNLKEAGIFNAEIRDMFVSNELALKYSGLRDGDIITPQSVPDIYLFQSGDHYAVIDFFGIVAGTVGLDFVFDIVGASYALYKGDNMGFAVYSASVLIPFANGATSKSLIKVAENLNSLVTVKVGLELLQGVFKTNGDNILIKLSDDLAKKGLRDNHILLSRIDMLTKSEANDLLQDLSHSENLLTAMQQDSELVEIWVKFKTAKAGNSLKRDGDLLKKAKKLNCE